MQLAGDLLERRGSAAPPDKKGKALGVKRSGAHPRQLLLFDRATAPTPHPSHLDLQVQPGVPARQVANPAPFAVVESPLDPPTDATRGFFPRRTSRRTRALGSPKRPCTVVLGRQPGKRYVSTSRRGVRICKACHVFSRRKTQQTLVQSHFPMLGPRFLPTRNAEDPYF